MKRRQICWAHLLRRFVDFSERDGPVGEHGKTLLGYAALLFAYTKQFRKKERRFQSFLLLANVVRAQFDALVKRLSEQPELGELCGSMKNLWQHRDALWNFVGHEEVPMTNNHAERELRAVVMQRKRSFGSQSKRGSDFVARIMTVVKTLAKRPSKNVFLFLSGAMRAANPFAVGQAPSLFAYA